MIPTSHGIAANRCQFRRKEDETASKDVQGGAGSTAIAEGSPFAIRAAVRDLDTLMSGTMIKWYLGVLGVVVSVSVVVVCGSMAYWLPLLRERARAIYTKSR